MKRVYTIKEWPELKGRVDIWKNEGHRLVFTNGCFDILHPGHLALLEFARKQGGKIIVGLNSDQSVRKLKGAGRPVNPEKDRANTLLATEYVDVVTIFDDDTPKRILDLIRPDVLIKGDDYKFKTTVGAREVKARGGKVLFFKKIEGFSTTNIILANSKKIETKDK